MPKTEPRRQNSIGSYHIALFASVRIPLWLATMHILQAPQHSLLFSYWESTDERERIRSLYALQIINYLHNK